MSDPIGFVIKRPEPDDTGDYIIFITRPSAGPFGTAGTAIFAVDSVEVTDQCVRVQSSAGEIVFSKDLPFLLVPRTRAYPVTTKEAAEMQLAEKKEWEAVYEAGEAAGGLTSEAVTMTEDGRQRNNPGQYL